MLNSKKGVAITGTEGRYCHQRANHFDSADWAQLFGQAVECIRCPGEAQRAKPSDRL